MFGFINLNKPKGFTSHDCVAKTRRLLHTKKVGHGGTLDPEATGVLPIAVGKATRLLQFLPESKAYRGRIRLGVRTTTDDLEGEIVATHSADNVSSQDIARCLQKFQGKIEQTPPIYSAIKRKGKKLYELARQGIEVEVPTRVVTIYSCELVEIVRQEYLEVEVDIVCSEGTYIRAIARDLGAMLGVGGTLANLVRTQSCGLKLSESVTFRDVEQQIENDCWQLISPDFLLAHLARVTFDLEESRRWCLGQTISLVENQSLQLGDCSLEETEYLRVYSCDRDFLGVSILRNQEGRLSAKPKIVCASLEMT